MDPPWSNMRMHQDTSLGSTRIDHMDLPGSIAWIVVLSMPKQRWMTIQMLIWFIQICNLKNKLLTKIQYTNDLLILASLLGFHVPPEHPLHCKDWVAHLHHNFFFLIELFPLALHCCSSDLSKEPLLSSFNWDLFIYNLFLFTFSAELLYTTWQGVASFWSILWTLL